LNIELRKTLWAAADKLRSSMDAAEYKHLVLGLIFVKYISDAFDELRSGLRVALADPESELYLDDPVVRAAAEEDRDYYTAANVFWVPEQARWENLRAHAKQANVGRRIDAALDAIEAGNPCLKGILDKRFGRAQLEPGRLGELVDLVSTIGFGAGDKAKDVLGEVYEYFLGRLTVPGSGMSTPRFSPLGKAMCVVAMPDEVGTGGRPRSVPVPAQVHVAGYHIYDRHHISCCRGQLSADLWASEQIIRASLERVWKTGRSNLVVRSHRSRPTYRPRIECVSFGLGLASS
jgi:hypothetical protein